jgi:hypothetical protein
VALNSLLASTSSSPRRRPAPRSTAVEAEFKAAAGALDANSVEISKAIGSVYGEGAEQAFLPLWRRHIGFAVDYTVGVATKDQAKQQKAVNDLIAYTQDFGAFLASANPNLPKSVVADLVKHHVVTLKEVIDAQAAKDYTRAYAAERAAVAHMQMIADPLASAIVKQYPDKFTGKPRRRPPACAPRSTSAPRARIPGRRRDQRRPRRPRRRVQGRGGRARRQLGRHREGHRLGVRQGRRAGLPAPVAAPHRLLRGLHGGRRDEGQGQAGQGRQRPHRLHARPRGVSAGGQPEPAQAGRGRPGENIT